MNKKKNIFGNYRYLSVLSLAAILILWCGLTYGGVLDKIFLPKPTAVIQAIISMYHDGTLFQNIVSSMRRVLVGWGWSAVAALPIGLAMVMSKKFSAIIQPVIEFVRYLPIVALVPLTVLYLGLGETEKYTIIFIGTFFSWC